MGSIESLRAACTALQLARRHFAEWSASEGAENGPEKDGIYLLRQGIIDSMAAIFRNLANIPKDMKMPDFLAGESRGMAYLDMRLATVMLDAKGDLQMKFGDNTLAEVLAAASILTEHVLDHNENGILADAPDAGKMLLNRLKETVFEESTGLAWLEVIE